MNSGNRNHLIELLRFLAASWVALYHFNQPIIYINNFYRNFCKLGHLGVPVFFLISGYCMCIAKKHSKSPAEFLIKRLFRIFPPYWLSLVIVFVIVLGFKYFTGTNSIAVLPKTPGNIISTIFLYTTPASDVPSMNWVYWTLPYELAFYFIIFLTIFLSEKTGLISLTVLVIACEIIHFPACNLLFFTNQFPVFILGFALYYLVNKHELWLFSLILFVCALGGIVYASPIRDIITCLITSGLILLNNIKHLKENAVSNLGDISYSVYLIHVPIAIYLLGFTNYMPLQTNVYYNIIYNLALLTIVILLSKLSYKYVEKPSILKGKKVASMLYKQ